MTNCTCHHTEQPKTETDTVITDCDSDVEPVNREKKRQNRRK